MTVTGHAAEREPLVVLSVEDDPQFGALLRRVLEAEGFEVTIERVQSRGELESALQRRSWDVVLSDHSMPGFSSTHALQVIKARGLDIPFIIVSGYIGEENAVAVMRAGAYDYVPKTGLNRLGVAVRNARNAASERALLRQRERDLEALHAVAFAAGSALDAGRLATFASERARELLQTDTSSVYWWDPDTLVLDRIARSTTRTDEGIARLLVGDSMAGRAFEQREAMVVDDYPTWPHRSKDTSAVRSGMAVPMFIGDRAVGAFTATSMVPRRFSASEIRVLSVLAAEVAPAIETSRLVAAAQYAASYDSLTGLPNRALFTARLEAQTAECAAQGRSFALIFADLDDFREINDAFGRDAGNAVLRELGVRLRGLGGVGDAVGRFGGDEFGMRFPPGSDVAFATRAAEAAIEFLKEPFVVEGQSVHLAASIGIVGFPEHGTTAEILLQRAEEAMVAAKRSRARHRVYTSDLDPHSQQRIALVTELRRAMTERQLVLHYQPQVDVPTGRIVAAEALLRWRHPHRGLVPPMDFIGLAEQTGLILELTPWVITEALRQRGSATSTLGDLRVSINVSMRDLQDLTFLERVAKQISESGVAPSSLTFEITEGTIMLEAERTLQVLAGLRALGLGVAIDDFGTGYSSLSYLDRLPVDEVKIDKSFVMSIDAPEARAIVSAVIGIGRAIGVRVVAEGVKDEATLETLRAMDCPLAQGFVFTPALPADELDVWRRRRTSGPAI